MTTRVIFQDENGEQDVAMVTTDCGVVTRVEVTLGSSKGPGKHWVRTDLMSSFVAAITKGSQVEMEIRDRKITFPTSSRRPPMSFWN